MSIDLKKLADEAMDEMMSHFPKECGFDGSCYICKDGAYAFARQVTEAVLSESRARCHALIIKGEADPGNIIRVFKTLKRELCGDASQEVQQ